MLSPGTAGEQFDFLAGEQLLPQQRLRVTEWPIVRLALLCLFLLVAWLYAPSLGFGLIWDDPHWFGRVVGKSLWQLAQPAPDFHFYRPGTMIYNRIFARADGRIDAPLLHLAQISWHLLNLALGYAFVRRLGLPRMTAVVTTSLLALHPFAYQAVAWAAPQQPLATALQLGSWLAYLEACRGRRWWRFGAGLSLLLFAIALTVQENAVVMAFMPLILELFRLQRPRPRRAWLAFVYPAIGAMFGLLWLMTPRQAGYTSLAFDPFVSLYLLQGFVFPLVGRVNGYTPDQLLSAWFILGAGLITIVVLLLAAWQGGHGRLACFAVAWASLGLLLPAAGLDYSYVTLSPRLFYYAVPAVALLWSSAALPRQPLIRAPLATLPLWRSVEPAIWYLGGALLLVFIWGQSILLLQSFTLLYRSGVNHLNQLNQVVSLEDERLVFVNFPDRYAPKRPPYPLGYWGVTLAPISVDLGSFTAAISARPVATESYSMPWLDAEARDAGPYQLDLRGVITSPDILYQSARTADRVYFSRYTVDGGFDLIDAGAITAGSSAQAPVSCRLASFDGRLCLQAAVVTTTADLVELSLTWSVLATLSPHETIFAHIGQPGQQPIAQADGDPWFGLLPLSVWQPGDTIQERREIRPAEVVAQGDYLVRVGLYNWVTEERLPATTLQSDRVRSDAVIIAQWSWPAQLPPAGARP
jgi:hypothetical protein